MGGSFSRSGLDFFAVVLILAAGAAACAQTPAFPGAMGFGAFATGGRTGTVYHVTTLADGGPGSFREAVSKPNRIIVFDVGGYIDLQTAVAASSSLTIAGCTLLEHYLNWLAAPHALAPAGRPLEVNLSAYAAGFTNASPVYAVFEPGHGTVALLGDGHTAHYTPAENFRGLAGFKFSVRSKDGDGRTNMFGVVVADREGK